MKILILSFKAGEGHNAAARAVLEEAQRRGHNGVIVDFLGLVSDRLSHAINVSYGGMVKHAPGMFGTFYKLSAGVSRKFPKLRSPLYLDSAIISAQLKMYLEQTGPYDGIVATHLMPAQALSHLKKHGYPLPVTVAVATDYTYYPFWQEVAACDYYVLPDRELIPEYLEAGMRRDRLCPFGIPIGGRYRDLPSKKEARERLELPQAPILHLVMGGSMGAGNMQKLVDGLWRTRPQNEHLVIICGNNRALRATLSQRYASSKRVHTVGFTSDVPLYMAACDLLYTKPGGLSTSEALAANIPLVYSAPIPGCESDNYKFFTKRLCALGSGSVEGQLRAASKLLSSPRLRERMRAAQRLYAKPECASRIVELIEKKAN